MTFVRTKFIFYSVFVIFVLIFRTNDTQAHVVVGGNMSYEFIGTGKDNKELVYDVFLNFDVVCELFDDENFSLIVFDELGNTVFNDFPTTNLFKSCEVEPTDYECANIDFDYCIENRTYKTIFTSENQI